jgi:hypothetical protein
LIRSLYTVFIATISPVCRCVARRTFAYAPSPITCRSMSYTFLTPDRKKENISFCFWSAGRKKSMKVDGYTQLRVYRLVINCLLLVTEAALSWHSPADCPSLAGCRDDGPSRRRLAGHGHVGVQLRFVPPPGVTPAAISHESLSQTQLRAGRVITRVKHPARGHSVSWGVPARRRGVGPPGRRRRAAPGRVWRPGPGPGRPGGRAPAALSPSH